MKFVIHDSVLGARIRDLIPGDYRGRVPGIVRSDGIYTLVVFSEDVVRVRTVAKALEQINRSPTGTIVAVGRDFTQEARGLLIDQAAVLVARGEFGWTEASYEAVR